MLNLNLKRKMGALVWQSFWHQAPSAWYRKVWADFRWQSWQTRYFRGARWRKSIYRGHSPGSEDMNFMDVRSFRRSIFTGRSGKSAAVCLRAAGISGVWLCIWGWMKSRRSGILWRRSMRESQYMCLYRADKIECRTRETRTLHEYRWLQVLLRKRTGRQRLRVWSSRNTTTRR